MTPTHFAVLGRHPAASAPGPDGPGGEPLFDAVDVLLRGDDGEVVVVGIRTAGYLAASHADPGVDAGWDAGYRPLPVTVDVTAARFWDFDRVLWLGPDPWPCLVWSNAEGLTELGLSAVCDASRPNRVLDGPDGRGLPAPAALGFTPPARPAWRPLVPMTRHARA